ncbi:MAG: hypothetical protein ACYDG6_14645 [Thermincolia bacterium]
MKLYCTQNNGDCSTCSLVSYNRDCQNNPIRGGYRPGAGRKPTGRKKHQLYITDAEAVQIKELLDQLRNPSK